MRSSLKVWLMRKLHVRKLTITKGLTILLFLTIVSLVCLSYYVQSQHYLTTTVGERVPLQTTVKCTLKNPQTFDPLGPNHHDTNASRRLDKKVLVLIETQYSRLGKEIFAILEANRIKFKWEIAGKSLPFLTHMDKGKYSVVVFENLNVYLHMDLWNRQLLDKYCREYNVGIIAFTAVSEESRMNALVKGFPLSVHTNLALRDYELNPNSKILRVTRAGEIAYGELPGDDWTVFIANHSTYIPISYAKTLSSDSIAGINNSIQETKYVTAIQDRGAVDGIKRVFFGSGFRFWLHRPLFLDALSYLSHGKLSVPLERHILIDIDDIFVGKKGSRMVAEDVLALLASQKRLQQMIEGFRFNLGFSGKYFHHGTDREDLGDDLILKFKNEFWWFGHMWSHSQPHLYTNVSLLQEEMLFNQRFSKEHGIPVNSSYAIAPHHSGVYPIHEPLYEAWKRVWGIRVTSTEEYPHLRPASRRKGFIHKNIKVLPRQTCGLFTHTIFIDKYPGGRQRLENSIRGGELMQTILYNPINIFMTHLSNYGNDRLALYTFESVMKFAQCWTNLQFFTEPPLKLAELYFDRYPEEKDAVWGNPCDDKRHLMIWSANKSCERLPKFLVIGPQKTGTTALYAFLSMHPIMVSNHFSPSTFEEVQFFNGNNYFKGIDWYMSFFPHPNQTNTSMNFVFEKSANYFDSDDAPRRSHALLPKAKLITILISPSKRAYSWYQHVRAHNDVAFNYTFYEVVTADDNSPRRLKQFRNRCLNPGMYAHHLEKWLEHYQASQLLILDGEELKNNPILVMDKVQRFLRVEPRFDYSKRLKFNSRKGFYCQIINGDHTKCLGRNKGRVYPPMEVRAEKFLRLYYLRHNIALQKLLTRLGQKTPKWLAEELSDH